jgi:regulator of protease activity HflC (stomatin/prohibitin superfamily)
MAPVFAGQLAWCLGVSAVLTAGCLAVGFAKTPVPSAQALGLHLLLVTGVLAALWRMVALRASVSLERETRAETQRKEAERAKQGRQSLFAGEPEGIPRHWTTEFKIEGYAHARQRIILIASAAVAGLLSFLGLTRAVPSIEDLPASTILGVGTLDLVIGFACILASRYFGLIGRKGIREAPALAGWLRGVQWLSFGAGVALFLGHKDIGLPGAEPWVTRIILAWTVLCALELIVRAVVGLTSPRKPYEDADVPMELIAVQLVFASANPLRSLESGLERYLGISLQASWGLRFLGRAFLPLVFLLGVLMWAMTCVEVVHPNEQAILERLGQPVGQPLGPGLHVKWPWPIDRVYHYPALQVSALRIGSTRTAADEARVILWTKPHVGRASEKEETGEEYKLILNEGNELVSVDAFVYYRIANVTHFAYQMQNPDAALRALTYRELTHSLLTSRLDDFLGHDRPRFPDELGQRIQKAADKERLGIEIVKVTLVNLHPPVEVADAYQDVVSAQIEAETRLIGEAAWRAQFMPGAEGDAVTMLDASNAAANQRIQAARGEAEEFRALLDVHRRNPYLFKTARAADTLEQVFSERPFTLLDDALDTQGRRVTVDLRHGLGWPFMDRGLPLP